MAQVAAHQVDSLKQPTGCCMPDMSTVGPVGMRYCVLLAPCTLVLAKDTDALAEQQVAGSISRAEQRIAQEDQKDHSKGEPPRLRH